MKAMILAAGRGTRMGALTESTPKPLVKVAGVPMVQYVVDRLKGAGVSEFVVNTFYQAEQVEQFFLKDACPGIPVHISPEKELLETGGGILHAEKYLRDALPFIVHNADVYSEIDLLAMVAAHNTSGALATLAIKNRDTSRRLLFDSDLNLSGWENTATESRELVRDDAGMREERLLVGYGFCGVHVLSQQIFDHFRSIGKERFSVIDAYLAAARAGLKVHGYDVGTTPWFDIGTPEKLAVTESFVTGGKQ